jgi:hypothetical protein
MEGEESPIIEITIRTSQDSLSWVIPFLNEYIASRPMYSEPLAHEFVTALSNPIREPS